ncbi:MAG TPA: carboxypeptidase regulatory-like domain-containing protein [Pyrinomonadaceae bacterium]|nr:carboxypeptidase regulatory-like domain-containing protein [Pyrinomonadaceae bacterium]
MGSKPFAIALVLVALLLSSVDSSYAQGTTTRVTGTVTDSSGAAIAGAMVTLTNEATNATLTTQTSNQGVYVFDLVQPGTYSVTIEKQGFKRFVSSRNILQVNIPAAVNATLDIGDVSAVVSVEASAEVVQTATSGNVGSTLGEREIESLPIVGARGRNPFDLLNFQPGVTVGANTGGGIHVHGARDRAFNFTLDGIDINESTAGGSNFTPLRTNPESIRELQIVTSNFTAELGRSSGAQVSLTTRSGTNRFSGNLFEFYQTPEFHANEWEFNKQGIAKRQFVQHIYGGSFGGPLFDPTFGDGRSWKLLRDKAFFFVNLQMLRASETRLQTLTVYTPQARAGLYRYVQGGRNAPFGTVQSTTFPTGSAVNADGSPRYPACGPNVPNPCIATYDIATGRPITLDPFIASLLARQQAPNDFTGGDGLNTAFLRFVAPQTEKQYDFVMRFDVNINDQNHVYFRYAQGEQNTFGDIANAGLARIQGGANWIDTFRNPKNLAINYRWSPTAKFVNEFIFGMNSFGFRFEYPASNPQVPIILNNVTDFDRNFAYNARSSKTWQFVDNMTFDLSPHTLKFGVNFRLGDQFDDRSSAGGQIEPQVTLGAGNSSFVGWNVPDASGTTINTNDRTRLLAAINDLIGRIGGITQGFVVSPGAPNQFAPAGTRWNWKADYPELDFYIQDTWRVRQNLTFDMGVRWEVKYSPSSKDLPILTPSLPFTLGAAPTNQLRWTDGKLYSNDYDNFSPSLGLAWDPFKSGKTSVRANYRLSYDRFPSQVFANFVFQSAPGNTFQSSIAGVGNQNLLIRNGLPNMTPAQSPDQLRQPPAFATTSIVAVDPDIKFPENHQWFAGIQREIWGGNVLEVNYIGRRGVHLFGAYNANQVNIFARDPRCNQNFLEAFNAVRGGSTNECLINYLFTGNNDNNAGTTTFRGLAAITPTLAAGSTGGSVATAALVVSQHTTGGVQTIGRAANFNNPYFFQPFPQFTGGLNVLETNDLSRYNGLEFIVKRRFQKGLAYQVAYTYSVSKDTRSWDPTFATANTGSAQSASSTPFDLRDRSLNYAWSDFDRRHVIQSYFTYDLPFGRGRMWGSDIPRGLDWIVGGWQISGLVNLGSGRPYTFYSGRNTISQAVQSPVSCNGCPRNLGQLEQVNGIPVWFTAAQLANITQPNPGELGNTGRNYFIGPRSYTADGSVSKKFRFSERWSFDLRIDAKNITNTPTYGLSDAAMLFTSASVGQINNTVLSFSRRVQISGKLNF